jgi:hypothetical protein
VYAVGSTRGNLGGPSSGGIDAWIARFDGSGNQVWINQLGTLDNDHATAAATDGAGGLFASGTTNSDLGGPNAGTDFDVWIARYDASKPPYGYCTA